MDAVLLWEICTQERPTRGRSRDIACALLLSPPLSTWQVAETESLRAGAQATVLLQSRSLQVSTRTQFALHVVQ